MVAIALSYRVVAAAAAVCVCARSRIFVSFQPYSVEVCQIVNTYALHD